jgi:hypothetical protein
MLAYRRWQRDRLRARYGGLLDEISTLLFSHDPIGISFEDNTDEYDAEAATILAGLSRCKSLEHALALVHSEFTRWFGQDIAGSVARYRQVAKEIWALWQDRSLESRTSN